MPVSNTNVVDAIGVDPLANSVELSMFEDRDWSEKDVLLKDLEAKINCYVGFVIGGQINDNPSYRGKPVIFDMYCQFDPPQAVRAVLTAIKGHLVKNKIGFRVFIGPDKAHPMMI